MRLILNAILVLAVLFASYVEYIYFFAVPPKLGEVVPFSVRSQGFFTFDQDKALRDRRDIALSRYVPLYTYLPGIAGKVKTRMDNLIKKVSILQKQKPPMGKKLAAYVHDEFGLEISLDEADKLLGYGNLTSLLNGILAFEETILQNIIVEDPEPYHVKNIIEVLYSKPKGIVAYPAEEVITLEQARFMLKDKVSQLFWQVHEEVLDPVIKISLSTLLPNLKYDKKENDRRIQEIVRRYPSKVIHYKPGDVLVPFRKVLSEEDLLLVVSHCEFAKKNLYGNTPLDTYCDTANRRVP